MLTKLLKYDFKSILKLFIPIWVALLAISLTNRILFQLPIDSEFFSQDFLLVVSGLIFYLLLCAMGVVAVVLIIQRFYRGLLRDEGYLMFTLPVKTWQLVLSKTISATVILTLSAIIGVIAFVLMGYMEWVFDMSWVELYQDFFSQFTGTHLFIVVLGIVVGILTIVKSITQVYVSMAMGHLFNKHRIILSVVSYIAINIVLTTTVSFLAQFDVFVTGYMEELGNLFITNMESAMLITLWISLAATLVQIAIFFFGTEFILRKHLNLE